MVINENPFVRFYNGISNTMKSFSCFKPRDPFRNWSKELDKRLAEWAKDFNSSFKLLLLGPAGSGKTTILKQMKIIHFEGFSPEERQQKAKEIRSNLLESVRELTSCITASGREINWADKENQSRLDFINGLNLDDQTYELYAAKIYDYSKKILSDKALEEIFAHLNQLSITHRSQYLLNRVDEIRNVNYIPNNDDILQSRMRTCDIHKLEFRVKLPVKSGPNVEQTFCMFDVGGQRGERRKWIQVFDGVSAVMFLIDSSSFDATDDENGKNKLRETLLLFEEVWTTRFLLNSNFVLLFNKQDILKEKIVRGHRIEDYFPEYKNYKYSSSNNDRFLFNRSSGDKLNLFRSSGRSSRSVSARSFSASSAKGTISTCSTRESRKSSLYRLSGYSLSSFYDRSKADAQRPEVDARSKSKTIPSSSSSANVYGQSAAAKLSQKQNNWNTTSGTDTSSSTNKQRQLLTPEEEYLKARSFIRDKFLKITRHDYLDQRKFSSSTLMYNSKGCASQPKRQVCYHYTTATDTENIRDLFENLQKMVIKSTMKDLR